MQNVAKGDEKAIETLYDRFGALVFKTSRQVLSSTAEAEDAVQEVFVRLWKSADRFDPGRARLVTWVMLITRRHLIDRLRRRAARPQAKSFEHDLPESNGSLPEASSRLLGEEGSELYRRVNELPALQRDVIIRAYFHGFTLREVSEQLETPLGTVKSALSRGLAKLRERGNLDEQAG